MKKRVLIPFLMGAASLFVAPAMTLAKTGISVDSELGHGTLIRNKEQTAYIRVRLQGDKPENIEERPPVNIALVIDKSGSMGGEKIKRAKEAAIMAINRLAADDIVSIITYDTRVDVLWPASKVGDSSDIKESIRNIRPSGSTALYAGTRQGIREISRFLDENAVNRVILISDGLANIGPSSPEALAELGQEAGQQGIAVTTIGLGLGYNEDLMAKLAFNSDGNHAFVKNAEDLTKIFNYEFGDVLSVVAQDIEVELIFRDDISPVRALGRRAKIEKNVAKFRLNQIYGSQQKEFILEIKTPKGLDLDEVKLVDIKINYLNMAKKSREKHESELKVKQVASEEDWKASANKTVMTSVATQIAILENERAVKLRDKGKVKEAKEVLKKNAIYLRSAGQQYGAKSLDDMAAKNADDAENLEGPKWNARRKSMRAIQHKGKTQQSY